MPLRKMPLGREERLAEYAREIKETKEFLNSVLNSSADGIITTDLEGRITFFSAGAENIFGYRARDVIGTPILDLYPKKLKKKRAEWGRMLFRGETIKNLKTQIYNASGKLVDINLSLSLLKNSEGAVIGTVGVSSDITKETNLQREVLQTKNYLENIFNTASDLIYVLAFDGRFKDLNKRVEELTGYRKQELIGMPFVKLLAPEYTAIFLANFQKRIKGANVPPYEVEVLRKKGDRSPLEIRGSRLEGVGVITIARDITNRKKAEMEIRRLGAAVSGMREFLIITDLEGTITYVNPALERGLGYTSHELLGKPIKVLHPRSTPKSLLRDVLLKTRQGGWEGEALNRRRNGKEFWVHTETSLIQDEKGEPIAMVWVSEDITKRKKLEQQIMRSEKLASVGLLAAGVAHEINNPLANISLYSEMLIRKANPGDLLVKKLTVIKDQAEVAAKIVKHLLEFSRQSEPEVKGVDVNKEISKVLGVLARRDSTVGVQIRRSFDTALPQIKADPGQLQQVFVNILTNATQAMPMGGRLEVATARRDKEIEIKFSDTGRGIPREIIDRIFDPFFTTKEVGKGTGLGLSICHGIVEKHNGTIEVESAVGKGTVVTVRLPVS
ncbi:MAG: PAS domain S-box protein [Candidatus Hydrothermarchaeota archaeon]